MTTGLVPLRPAAPGLAAPGLAAPILAAAMLAATAAAHAQTPSGPVNPHAAATARVKHAQDKGIFYGQESAKGAFPFVVSLIRAEADDDEEGNYLGQFCGGALVGDRWVVTGAQCAIGENEDKRKVVVAPETINIYAGSINFKDGKRIKVKRVIMHPQFEHDSFNHDIALLELEESAASSATATIALATPENEATVAAVGKKVIAAGWGETERRELPQSLRHVEMDVLDSTMCNRNIINVRKANQLDAWARLARLQFALSNSVAEQVRATVANNTGNVVNDNMICSGKVRAKRDTCAGDNGGPLFAKAADGKFVLVGITSWGEGCGEGPRGLYGIYTRAARYAAWVRDTAK